MASEVIHVGAKATLAKVGAVSLARRCVGTLRSCKVNCHHYVYDVSTVSMIGRPTEMRVFTRLNNRVPHECITCDTEA